MDLSVTTGAIPARTELADGRGGGKAEDASGLPFEVALLNELQPEAPPTGLADPGVESGEEKPRLDVLAAPELLTDLAQIPTEPPGRVAALEPPPSQPLPDPASQAALLALMPQPVAAGSTVVAAPEPAAAGSTVPAALEPAAAGTVVAASDAGAEMRGRNTASRIPQASKAEAVSGNPATPPRDPAGVTDITKPEAHNFAALPDAPAGLRERVPDKALPEDPRFAARPHELPDAALASRAPAAEMPPRAEPLVAKEALPPDLLAAPPGGPSVLSAPTTPLTPHMSATSAHAASSAPPPPATAHITAPFGQAEWGDQFRDKVVWLVDRQQQTAELHIHPPHLGPVEVMLTLNDEKTSIAFVSAHPAVREAIEASFADLRATLEQRGLALDHSSVSADARDAREQLSQNAESARRLGGKVAATADEPQRARLAHYGLVDTFA